jgi:hypothetical protein
MSVRPHGIGALAVERLEGAGEQKHRNARSRGIVLDMLADLVAVGLRHDDVEQRDVGTDFLDLLQGLRAVAHREDLIVAFREGQLHDFLDGDAVVGEENFLRHAAPGSSTA